MHERLQLSQIWRYPVKSLRGDKLETARVDARGIRYDRQWMLVDEQGVFLSQRQEPRMVLVKTHFENQTLRLSAPGMQDLRLTETDFDPQSIEVRIWRDQCVAQLVATDADDWFRRFLGRDCRLVWIPPESVRQVDQDYAKPADQVGFADGFPFLLISQASLDDLNERLQAPIPMQRFRPNLVVSGCRAFAEDAWKRIRIGELTFRIAKPCSRCVVPTINPETGRRQGDEPIRTLLQYRKQANKVMFGQNLLHDGIGHLSIGMSVEILD